MAEETVRLYPSGAASVEAESWASLGSKKFWEELAQTAFKEAETVTNPTTRGIKTTGTVNQSMVYGTEATAKIPVGAPILAVSVHWWGKPSAAANKLTYQKTAEGGTEVATKTIEAGTTTEKWFKAIVSAEDLAKISRNSFTTNAFRSGWTNSKSGSETRWNDNYIEVTFEISGGVTIPLQAAASTSSASLAVTAETEVAVQPAGSASAAALAMTVPTQVPLAAASSASAASLSASAASVVSLAAAAAQSAATMTMTAATQVPLSPAASSSTASMTTTAPTRITLNPAASESAAILSITVPGPVRLNAASSESAARMELSTHSPTAYGTASLSITFPTRATLTWGTVNGAELNIQQVNRALLEVVQL